MSRSIFGESTKTEKEQVDNLGEGRFGETRATTTTRQRPSGKSILYVHSGVERDQMLMSKASRIADIDILNLANLPKGTWDMYPIAGTPTLVLAGSQGSHEGTKEILEVYPELEVSKNLGKGKKKKGGKIGQLGGNFDEERAQEYENEETLEQRMERMQNARNATNGKLQ